MQRSRFQLAILLLNNDKFSLMIHLVNVVIHIHVHHNHLVHRIQLESVFFRKTKFDFNGKNEENLFTGINWTKKKAKNRNTEKNLNYWFDEQRFSFLFERYVIFYLHNWTLSIVVRSMKWFLMMISLYVVLFFFFLSLFFCSYAKWGDRTDISRGKLILFKCQHNWNWTKTFLW